MIRSAPLIESGVAVKSRQAVGRVPGHRTAPDVFSLKAGAGVPFLGPVQPFFPPWPDPSASATRSRPVAPAAQPRDDAPHGNATPYGPLTGGDWHRVCTILAYAGYVARLPDGGR